MADDLDSFLQSWKQPTSRVVAGRQTFASDRIYVCDPLDMASSPITTSTPTGLFEIAVHQRLWSPHRKQPKSLTNAFLAIEFSTSPCVQWCQVEADVGALNPKEFSAEFGAIAFFDTDTRERALSAAQGVKNAFDDWLAQYVMDGEKTRDFANVPLADGSNFVVCRSGWSNGTYCAFLGTDTSGAAAQLVIDFGIQ